MTTAIEPTHLCQHQELYLKSPAPRSMGFNYGALQPPHTLGLPLPMQLMYFMHQNLLDCH